MKEKTLSEFRVKVSFDKLIHAVYKKANPRKISEKEAYFSMKFYPNIFVEGAITNEGDTCLIEFNLEIKLLPIKIIKYTSILFATIAILMILFSDMPLSEKAVTSFFVLGIVPLVYFTLFLNTELFKAIADSNVRKIFRSAAN
ncbi:MAG: hypothetical protein JJ971_03625 [Balneolaceae bacterium]|nr:hypothetical protein [Balneolaceae bacterium]MBO6545462.1 hypothetical protein [Balneolaceae bacterium]MBO6646858.1 hypothetical protein [Balneolaceae bacterium]